MVCATSKASDQPGHTHSLIRAFAYCLNILWLLSSNKIQAENHLEFQLSQHLSKCHIVGNFMSRLKYLSCHTGTIKFDHYARESEFGILERKKIICLCFWLNEECPTLLSSLGIDHRRRKTIPLWNSSGKKKISSGHHCMSDIYNIGHCVMTW